LAAQQERQHINRRHRDLPDVRQPRRVQAHGSLRPDARQPAIGHPRGPLSA
jgi:hypothetical protein